mmetsp:Transcript_41844/g.105534  ORF Transcript_41844/g.105534 Transcript_41844/m.105534 type:complete len:132 (-) Transcript_41844:169-564(-)
MEGPERVQLMGVIEVIELRLLDMLPPTYIAIAALAVATFAQLVQRRSEPQVFIESMHSLVVFLFSTLLTAIWFSPKLTMLIGAPYLICYLLYRLTRKRTFLVVCNLFTFALLAAAAYGTQMKIAALHTPPE